jgi:hypothetical protein
MTEDKLTQEEKVTLLAIKDMADLDNYDEEFYKLVKAQSYPSVPEVDDRIRRAIFKFISSYSQTIAEVRRTGGVTQDEAIATALTVCLLKGYELGRKLRRPLTKKRR